jgi:uncharacterized metal-binding protein
LTAEVTSFVTEIGQTRLAPRFHTDVPEEEMENTTPGPAAKVIVYACSGASNLGQLANEIALRLDRLGLAELACLTEVGAGDENDQSPSKPVIAISGCTTACCAAMLKRHGIEVSRSIVLAERGVAKAKHVLVDAESTERVFGQVLAELAPFLEKPQANDG